MFKLTVLSVTVIFVLAENCPFSRFSGANLTQLLISREYEYRGMKEPLKELPSVHLHKKNVSNIAPDKFITAGSPTGPAQYPWLARLTVTVQELTGTNEAACGGSLISSRHVVTAAHCLDFEIRNNEDVSVYLAEYSTRTFPTDCVGSECVRNVVMHPDRITKHGQYQRRTVRNDIAMLRLTGPAPNSEYIRPIRLPNSNINDPKYEGTSLTIAGWGQTEHGQASAVKLHAQVQLVSPSTCRKYFPVTDGMVCAAGKNGQDSCHGDSGGPMVVERNGEYQLVGVVSFGMGKCGSSMPSVYTNVYAYLDWIQDTMRD